MVPLLAPLLLPSVVVVVAGREVVSPHVPLLNSGFIALYELHVQLVVLGEGGSGCGGHRRVDYGKDSGLRVPETGVRSDRMKAALDHLEEKRFREVGQAGRVHPVHLIAHERKDGCEHLSVADV